MSSLPFQGLMQVLSPFYHACASPPPPPTTNVRMYTVRGGKKAIPPFWSGEGVLFWLNMSPFSPPFFGPDWSHLCLPPPPSFGHHRTNRTWQRPLPFPLFLAVVPPRAAPPTPSSCKSRNHPLEHTFKEAEHILKCHMGNCRTQKTSPSLVNLRS